ncbi:HET-domain-containing protein [Lepidopterella palustris CBS 459.81]|uniref:HET-domain-containing protein n=1 Tax=Lepidopterella palustris CBS 459.81 TaxID=1314670 RepID=A0A8E2E743_9PEZI|nr:HET-domain-containing protein [Lepidopterella palustris CBS 459.81]
MDTLCDRCITIPRPIHFRRSSHFPSRSIGTKAQIKARKDRCPFCRLIYNALFDNPTQYSVEDQSKIGVIWNGEYYYFSASHGEEIGIKIAVIQEEGADPSAARYARAVTGSQVDLSLVQSWLDQCREHHQQGSALQQMLEEPSTLELPARVIDTQKACVVSSAEADPNMRYVTLSYVWGQAAQYMLVAANKAKLMSDGAFTSIQDQLPRTIQDAMEVVNRLGMRYLWVDALCIVQDDEKDRTKEIYRMDSIYEGSAFTLVAASGTDANAGLAALHARKDDQDYETIWPGVRMTAIHDLEDILGSSRYGTRGWTFQEQTLSSRLLVFTNSMAYFHCHGCTWSENSWADATPRQQSKIGGPRTSRIVKLDDKPWVLYCDYLKQYSLRQLTNEGDRVDAMMGILQRIRHKLQCRLVHGLLSDAFEWSLFFDVSSCQRQPLFPSYSWAGWKGEVDTGWPMPDVGSDSWRDSDNDEDSTSESSGWTEKTAENVNKSTWIVWYERPPQGNLRLINECDSLPGRQSDIQALKVRLFTTRARIKHNVLQTQPTHDLHHLQTQIPNHYSVLQFWTISVKLCLRKFGVSSVHRVNLVDAKDEWCGQLRLPHDFEPQYGKVAEMILLATTDDHHILEENARMFNGVESLGPSPKTDPSLPDFYRAMWIQWHGDIAERVAVGEIHYSALRRPVEGKAAWKEIILK